MMYVGVGHTSRYSFVMEKEKEMIVVVVPESGVDFSQLDYSGGVYEYDNTPAKRAFERFTFELIDSLNMLYKAANRGPICELPDDCAYWKPVLSPSVVYEYRGYLKIPTPSALNMYNVYVFSSTADGRFYSWKENRFDKIFNGIIEQQKSKRYVCKIFYTKKNLLEVVILYAKSIDDLRIRLDSDYNPLNRLRHTSTSDKTATSFSELFYNEDNRLELAIQVERSDN